MGNQPTFLGAEKWDPLQRFFEALDDRSCYAPSARPAESLAVLNTHIREVQSILRKVTRKTEQVVIALERIRNQVIKINTLPKDILTRIFCMASTDTNSSDNDPRFELHMRNQWDRGYTKWKTSHPAMSISTTCVSWRNIALKTPRMWTVIDSLFTRREHIPLFLKRSTGMALEVFCGSSHCTTYWPHILGRTKRLRVTVRSKSNQLPRWLKEQAPLLETLTMRGPGTPSTPSPFNLVCPRLRRLTLDGPHIPWSSSVFSSLRYVSLTIKKNTLEAEDTDILHIFRSSPALETFRLHSPCSFLGGEQSPSNPLCLPRLQLLDLKLPAGDASFILSSIQTSAKLNLIIAVVLSEDTPKPGCIIELPSDPRCLPSLSLLSSLSIDFDGKTISGTAHGLAISLCYSSEDEHCSADEPLLAILRRLQSYYPLPYLKALRISGYFGHSSTSEEIRLFLIHANRITKLELDMCDTAVLADIQLRSEHAFVPLYPYLGSVIIRNICMDVILFESLFKALAKKKPLLLIHLDSMHIDTPAHADLLKAMDVVRGTCTGELTLTKVRFYDKEKQEHGDLILDEV